MTDAFEFEPRVGHPHRRGHQHVETSRQKSRQQIHQRIPRMSAVRVKRLKEGLEVNVSVEIHEIAEKERGDNGVIATVQSWRRKRRNSLIAVNDNQIIVNSQQDWIYRFRS